MYVSYDYYAQTFLGDLGQDEFVKAEMRAEAIIRYLTFHNGDIFAQEDDAVKNAVCAAADVVHSLTSANGSDGLSQSNVRSVSNDGYSVSFSAEKTDGQTTETFLQKKVLDAVRIYLTPTGWLCRWMGGFA